MSSARCSSSWVSRRRRARRAGDRLSGHQPPRGTRSSWHPSPRWRHRRCARRGSRGSAPVAGRYAGSGSRAPRQGRDGRVSQDRAGPDQQRDRSRPYRVAVPTTLAGTCRLLPRSRGIAAPLLAVHHRGSSCFRHPNPCVCRSGKRAAGGIGSQWRLPAPGPSRRYLLECAKELFLSGRKSHYETLGTAHSYALYDRCAASGSQPKDSARLAKTQLNSGVQARRPSLATDLIPIGKHPSQRGPESEQSASPLLRGHLVGLEDLNAAMRRELLPVTHDRRWQSYVVHSPQPCGCRMPG